MKIFKEFISRNIPKIPSIIHFKNVGFPINENLENVDVWNKMYVDHLSRNIGEHEVLVKHGATLKHLGTEKFKFKSSNLEYHVHHMEMINKK